MYSKNRKGFATFYENAILGLSPALSCLLSFLVRIKKQRLEKWNLFITVFRERSYHFKEFYRLTKRFPSLSSADAYHISVIFWTELILD